MAGILVALIGIAVVSYAGHQKEVQMGAEAREFNVKLGLTLAVMCGIFSSGMSFAIDAARPITASAQQLGVSPLYAALPAYVLIMGGGAVINMAYCFFRLGFKRDLSLRADLAQPRATLLKNGSLAAAGGIMWYLQFFFYAWGAANIPQRLSYVNWMLHMSIYVLCGGLVGLALGEWTGVARRPIRLLWAGILDHHRGREPGGSRYGYVNRPSQFVCGARLSSGKRQLRIQACRNQVGAQLGSIGENRARHTEFPRGIHVRRPIVNKKNFARGGPESIDRAPVDCGIGLGHS